QRGADPGQERPFVGEGEPRVRLFPHAVDTPWPTPGSITGWLRVLRHVQSLSIGAVGLDSCSVLVRRCRPARRWDGTRREVCEACRSGGGAGGGPTPSPIGPERRARRPRAGG